MCSLKVRFTQSPERRNVFEYALKAEIVSSEGISPKIFVYHQKPAGLDGNAPAEFDHVATPVDMQEIPEDAASETVPWYRTDKVTVWLRNACDLETAKKLLVDDIACLQKAYSHLSSENDFTVQETVEFSGGQSVQGSASTRKAPSMAPDAIVNAVKSIVVALACMVGMASPGAEAYKAELNTLDLDTHPMVVTNVTFDGLEPGNYPVVSNAAMNVASKRDKGDLAVYTYAPWTVTGGYYDGHTFIWDSEIGSWRDSQDGETIYYNEGTWYVASATVEAPEDALSIDFGTEGVFTRESIFAPVSPDDTLAKTSELAGKLDAEGSEYNIRSGTPGLIIDSVWDSSERTYIFSKPGYEGDPNTVARLSDIPDVAAAAEASTNYTDAAILRLSGKEFDLSTNAGLYLAVSNIVTILGGRVTGSPSVP